MLWKLYIFEKKHRCFWKSGLLSAEINLGSRGFASEEKTEESDDILPVADEENLKLIYEPVFLAKKVPGKRLPIRQCLEANKQSVEVSKSMTENIYDTSIEYDFDGPDGIEKEQVGFWKNYLKSKFLCSFCLLSPRSFEQFLRRLSLIVSITVEIALVARI